VLEDERSCELLGPLEISRLLLRRILLAVVLTTEASGALGLDFKVFVEVRRLVFPGVRRAGLQY